MSKSQEIAFEQYLEQVKKLIIKIAGVYCYHSEDRKDLIQEIILQLWKAFPKYDGQHAFSTWTYRIALNVAISNLRKVTTTKKKIEQYRNHADILNIDDDQVNDQLKMLYAMIGELKPIDKAIITMHLDGCKNPEIAEVMGLSNTNVSTKLERIRKRLKSNYESKKM